MKIHILSDLHLELLPEIRQQQAQTDVVVLAGDIHTKGRGPRAAAELFPGQEIVMIAGNHEFYGKSFPKHLDDLRNEAASVPGVHLLENDIVEIGDVVFLGCTLWTDLKLWPNGKQTAMEIATRMNDYSNCHFYDGCQRRKLAPEDLVKKHLASVRWLREQLEKYRGRKLVVVTHHAPSLLSLPKVEQQDILAAAYASNLDKLVEESGALLWIHGHTHNVSDYSIGKTRVICNPVGYPKQQTGFDAEKVVVV